MSRGRAAVAALAVAIVSAGAVAAISTGSKGAVGGSLEWAGTPRVERVPELPRDRVLVGEVRNVSDGTISVSADRVKLVTANNEPVESTARFASAFGHGLYSPIAAPQETPELQQLRLGEIAEIAPGETAPLTLSWRLEGGQRPVSGLVGDASLDLPAG